MHKFYRLLGRELSIRTTPLWKNLGAVALLFSLDIQMDPAGFLFVQKFYFREVEPLKY